jgi:hypothetical protein
MTTARFFGAVALAAVSIAVLPANAASPKAKGASRCMAQAAAVWDPPGPARFVVEAFADGPRCQQAVTVLVIRAPTGTVLYDSTHQTAMVLPLSEALTSSALRVALQAWIARGDRSFATTRQLPDWQAGQDGPTAGEFPFYPEDGTTQAQWRALRTSARPVFCYVQGMESLKCLSAGPDGSITPIGVQSFPG